MVPIRGRDGACDMLVLLIISGPVCAASPLGSLQPVPLPQPPRQESIYAAPAGMPEGACADPSAMAGYVQDGPVRGVLHAYSSCSRNPTAPPRSHHELLS